MKPRDFGSPVNPHYVITISRRDDDVTIAERWDDGTSRDIERARLSIVQWDLIADHLRATFNNALRRVDPKLSLGRWGPGENRVDRLLGKELLVLAWGIEGIEDTDLINTALLNWSGLQPEERWWLATATAATDTGLVDNGGRGWRAALVHALTENSVRK